MAIDLKAMLLHAGELQRATTLGELLQVTHAAVRSHTRYVHSWLAVVDSDDPGFMYFVNVTGSQEALVLATCPRLSVADDVLVQEILESGEPVVVVEAAEDPRTDKQIVALLKNRTLVNVAMAVGTERMGTFGVGTYGDEGVMVPTETELEWLVVFATQLASAVVRLNLLARQEQDTAARVKLERHLEALQRVELMGVLAAGVAHDLNNYLQVIHGNLTSLEPRTREDAETFEDMLHATTKASEVARQLLSLGRSASLKQGLDLNRRVESTLKLVRSAIPRGVTVSHDAGQVPPVEGDPVQIDQALANLLINARDAVGDTGKIVVAVSDQELHAEFARSNPWAKAGRYGRVRVHDDGPGIPPELLERIYDPLFTTKATGTGLGLAVVSRVVQQHRGLLHVESRAGAGTSFDLYLPAQ
ncbi:MAG: ATP-binding protein [Archangium sp.]|nr:ATP-binding protein [Archangium sp.]MDP3152320.1 ATP-binding protein [Archangium sp.]MDP3570717.1 ATP-binding protein [Archangium sp.]